MMHLELLSQLLDGVLQLTLPGAVAASFVGLGAGASNFGQDPTAASAGQVAAAVSPATLCTTESHHPGFST